MSEELIRVIPKARVASLTERWMKEGEVIAPMMTPWNEEIFGTVTSPDEILWDFVNPLHPPKHFLLPQTEPLAVIRGGEAPLQVESIRDEAPRILLNLRNCDLSGILYLVRMMSRDLPDTAFLRRADSFTLVSLSCTTPCPLGFCVCCGAGPFLRKGFDLQITDLGDALMAEVGGEKGLRLLEVGEDLHRQPTAGERERREWLEAEALRSFGEVTCHFGSAMRRISTRRVDESLWAAMAPWCLECGGCNLACPTCYCFSVKDRAIRGLHPGGGGEDMGEQAAEWKRYTESEGPGKQADLSAWIRCRIWDSCQYEAFTMEASGHNPRAGKVERMKRRFYHKVSAQCYQMDGVLGCVGCGRCIKVCMGTTDMPAVVVALRKGSWRGSEPREREGSEALSHA